MGRTKLWMSVAGLAIGAAVSFFPLRSDEPDFTIRADVQLVLLDVSVSNHGGRHISALKKSDFRVSDNGVPVDLSVFANNDIPVTVGVLVDESYSMLPKRLDVIRAALAFIEASNPQDEVFVVNFNDTVRPGLPKDVQFSGDITQLRAALYNGIPEGKTALNDAVAAGLQHLQLGRRDKKTLVLISDGGDNASHTSRPDLLNMVEKSAATIYTIGIFDEADPDRDPAILKKLARISGGEAYFPETPAGMLPVCREIATDVRTRYTLGYRPPSSQPGQWHKIRVEASAAGYGRLSVRTRPGYWSQAAPQVTGGSQ